MKSFLASAVDVLTGQNCRVVLEEGVYGEDLFWVEKWASPVRTFTFLGNKEVGDEAVLLERTRQQFEVEPHSCIGKDRPRSIKLHANSSFSTSALQALP